MNKKLEPFYPLDINDVHYSEEWAEFCGETWIKPLEAIGLKYIGHISWMPADDTYEGCHILQFSIPGDFDEELLPETNIEEEGLYATSNYVWDVFTVNIYYTT